MPASSLHSCLHLGTWAEHPPPPPARGAARHQAHGHFTQGRRGEAGKSQKNEKGRRGPRVRRVRAGRERHGTRPRAGRSLPKKRRTLKAQPSSLGITKAQNYKTKYKGGESVLQRAIRSPALPSPCRGVRVAASPPVGRAGAAAPLRRALPGAPASAACPRLLLTPCSRCWLGSGGASPGRCRRGARSPRSPSRSAGSSCSL